MSSTEELDNINYNLPQMGKSKWITSLSLFFFIGLFSYFPFMYKIESTLKKQLKSIPGCALSYNKVKLEFFLPKVIINDLILPQSCFGKYGDPIKIDSLFFFFRGLSFSPFGPHFKIETNVQGLPIESYLTTGLGGVAINLRENTFDLQKLQKIIPEINLSGKLIIDAMVKLKGQSISDLKLNVRSKNFTIPGQDINGFRLSTMRLNNLLFKANMVAKKLKVEDFILGDEEAAVRANFKGDIKLNQKNITVSTLDLAGEVAFSNDFLSKYALIKVLMNKFDKKDQFYQIKLTGPLTRPKPSSLR